MEENLDMDLFFRNPKTWLDVNFHESDCDHSQTYSDSSISSFITQENDQTTFAEVMQKSLLTDYVRRALQPHLDQYDLSLLSLEQINMLFNNSPEVTFYLPKAMIVHLMTCFAGKPDFYIEKVEFMYRIFKTKEKYPRRYARYKDYVESFSK